MKKISLIIYCIGSLGFARAQNNVGIGTSQPNPTAILHVDAGTSLTKGLLVTGDYDLEATIPNLGNGSRLMFYPGKGAFRAGYVENGLWNNNNAGFFSMGLGYNTLANGHYSTATGYYTTASGLHATAMGFYTMASGENSSAIGIYSTASGINSFAIGAASTASGNQSTALGGGTAIGVSSIALGAGQPSGLRSITIGGGTARGDYSIAMGLNTKVKAYSSVTIGAFNDTTDMPDATSPKSTDRIFQLGNGTSYGRDNAVTVLRNGNTGIGVLDPFYQLDLASRMRIRSGGSSSYSAGIWLNKNDNSTTAAFMGIDGNNDVGFYGSGSSWSFVVNTTNGNAWLKGTLTQNSDARLKKNITPINRSLSQLLQLNGYHYYWKEENREAGLQTGLLAQEVKKLMPELVKEDNQGTLSVNYTGLIPYIIEATKEEYAMIMEQKAIVQEQQSIIQQLQTQLNDLKQIVEQLTKK